MDLYAENILEHYRSPRHQEPLENPNVTHGEKNVSCGDSVTLSLKIENGVITGISWEGTGCAISQAGMSMLSEELIGKTEAEAAAFPPSKLQELLGVPVGPRRIKCALLSLHTLKNTLRALHGQPPQLWRETVEVEE